VRFLGGGMQNKRWTTIIKHQQSRYQVRASNSSRLLLALTVLLLLALLLLLLGGTRLGLGLVHLVEEAQAGLLELIGLGLHLLGGDLTLARLALGDELTERGDLLADGLGLGLVNAVLELLEGLLGVVGDRVGTVGGLNGSLAVLVLAGVLLGVVDHALDLLVAQTGAGGDGDRLVLVGGLVLGTNVDDGVGVNVEGDLNLGNTTVRRGDTDKLEVAEELVVADELTLTLVDLDLDSGLEVGGSGEGLGLLGGDGGVAVDQTGEDTAEGLDTKRQRGDIEEEEVSDLSREDTTLDRGTDGDGLVGVDRLGGVTAEDALDGLGDLGHTGHTTDKDDILDVLGLEVGILESLADGLNGPGDKGLDQTLELSAGHLGVDVLGARGVGSDEGKVDVGLEGRRQLNLGLLGGLADTLDGHAVAGKVNALLGLELLDEVTDEGNVKVLTTEVSVTVGGLDLEHTAGNLQNGDVKGTTPKVVNSDNAVILLETVGKSGGGGLVDHTHDVKTRDLTGVLGGLTLLVVEVGRDSNNGVLEGLADEGLSGLLHLSEDETTDLRRRVLLALGLEPCIAVGVLDDLVGNLLDVALDLNVGELATDETLGGEEGVLGVDDGLALGGNTDKTLALLGETDDRGGRASTCRRVRYPFMAFLMARVSLPSEFSMILGFMPSMSATAELVVPRSIPITGPLTFSSLSIFSAYDRLNDELMGALYAEERRVEVARGAAC
jgi:hypothetical protein